MTKQEFKKKYFTDNFYWVDSNTSEPLQKIGLEMDCVTSIGDSSIIEWHSGIVNLTYRTRQEGKPTVCQRQDFLSHTEKATSFVDMARDYSTLKQCCR